MAQKTGRCTAIWAGVRCSYHGLLVIHHLYRKRTGKRGKAYQQDACEACHMRAHEQYRGANGGPDDKWPDDPAFDGKNAPFNCGDNP